MGEKFRPKPPEVDVEKENKYEDRTVDLNDPVVFKEVMRDWRHHWELLDEKVEK